MEKIVQNMKLLELKQEIIQNLIDQTLGKESSPVPSLTQQLRDVLDQIESAKVSVQKEVEKAKKSVVSWNEQLEQKQKGLALVNGLIRESSDLLYPKETQLESIRTIIFQQTEELESKKKRCHELNETINNPSSDLELKKRELAAVNEELKAKEKQLKSIEMSISEKRQQCNGEICLLTLIGIDASRSFISSTVICRTCKVRIGLNAWGFSHYTAKEEVHSAARFSCSFELLHTSKLENILVNWVEHIKGKAVDEEIGAFKAIQQCIAEFKLESRFDIRELEMQKQGSKLHTKW